MQNAWEIKITPVLDKVQEYERKCLQHVKRTFCNRLQRIIEKAQKKRQKKQLETVEETATHVRPERSKWPQSILAGWLW